MSRYAANDQRSTFGTAPEARIEAGLRQHMQRIYGYMSAGLMLTALSPMLPLFPASIRRSPEHRCSGSSCWRPSALCSF
jgi:FtsH-binding integral membrane protein